jgi:SAM-dependent methyltransferase
MSIITTTQTDAAAGHRADGELELYDRMRQRLRDTLAGRLPDGADLEATVTAYAYWVCTVVRKRSVDWVATLGEYVAYALRDAAREAEAEQAEFALLRRALRDVTADRPLLDVGAGWGRMAPIYEEVGWRPVYVEPTGLGAQLMQRSGLARVAMATGEALPFPAATFGAVLIGWVLHHHSADLDAAAMVREAARTLAPGGWLFSIEPIRPGFDMARWQELLDQPDAGIVVRASHEFYQMPTGQGEFEQYTLVIGQKPDLRR